MKQCRLYSFGLDVIIFQGKPFVIGFENALLTIETISSAINLLAPLVENTAGTLDFYQLPMDWFTEQSDITIKGFSLWADREIIEQLFKRYNINYHMHPKHEFRKLFTRWLLKKDNISSLDVVFLSHYRDNTDLTTLNDSIKYAVILGGMFPSMPVAYSSELYYAFGRSRVLFWKALQIDGSKLLITKAIFRLSTFDNLQKEKLNNFIVTIATSHVVIKPVHNNETRGILSIHKNVLPFVINLMMKVKDNWADNYNAAVNDILSLIEYSSANKEQTTYAFFQAQKFVNYWAQCGGLSVADGDNDFFIIEEYLLPDEIVGDDNWRIRPARRTLVHLDRDNIDHPYDEVYISDYRTKRLFISLNPDANLSINQSISFSGGDGLFLRAKNALSMAPVGKVLPPNYDLEDGQCVNDALSKDTERNWITRFLRGSLNDLIEDIKVAWGDDPELMEYLESDHCKSLQLSSVHLCYNCFKAVHYHGMIVCSQCYLPYYCSDECCKQDQPYHQEHECVHFVKN